MIQASDRRAPVINMDPLVLGDNGSPGLFFVGCGREKRGVAAGGGEVGRPHPLERKDSHIIRATRLGPGARQTFATEGLYADHGANLVAIDIEVSDLSALGDEVSR